MEESTEKSKKGIGQYKSILLIIIVSSVFPFIMFQVLEGYDMKDQSTVSIKAGTLFGIERIENNVVYIRNIGLHEIGNLEFRIDNTKIQYTGPTTIGVGSIQGFSLNTTQLENFSYPNFLSVSALGVVNVVKVDFSGNQSS